MHARCLHAAVLAFLLAACAEGPARSLADGTGREGPQRFRVSATVLQDGDRSPMLCLGGIMLSDPPQCGTMPIVGWDWDAVEGEESSGGVVWGEYEVVGTYDGETFTLTDAPGLPRKPDGSDDRDPFATPCPEPPGGWRATDPSRSTEEVIEDLDLERNPEFAGLWIDDRGLSRGGYQDFTTIVLNVRFTGNLAANETWIRERWGGALCVSRAAHSYGELRRIQEELSEWLRDRGHKAWRVGVVERDNVVDLEVIWLDADERRELDERYGAGVVRVTTILEPID